MQADLGPQMLRQPQVVEEEEPLALAAEPAQDEQVQAVLELLSM